jgi:murein DD-endopeptidase MepM/ murein hydrolase activator NlpD
MFLLLVQTMAEVNENKRNLRKKLQDKYRLVILNDSTFEEVRSVKLSRLNVLALGSLAAVIGFSVVFLLIAYTPIRELIPGYDSNMRNMLIKNTLRLDSLSNELEMRDHYFYNIATIISGKTPDNYESLMDTSTKKYDNVKLNRTEKDLSFRKEVEDEDQFNISNLSSNTGGQQEELIGTLHFFVPVKGVVTEPFNMNENHLGTDIVAGPNEVVKATLDGTVIMATWTLETGYTITIQHNNNLLSIYKHNAELLKKVGSKVKAGEAIAIIGNSGELTTGPHLHFELWYNGKAVNPQDYMVF